MSRAEAFAALQAAQVGDLRCSVFEVALHEDSLTGVAEGRFSALLHGFARSQGLRVQVDFPAERPGWLVAGRAKVYAAAQDGANQVTEALYGEEVTAFDRQGGFVRVKLARDGYVGWLQASDLMDCRLEPTHRVAVLRTHAFAEPKVSATPLLELALGVTLRVENDVEPWLEISLPSRSAFVRKTVLEPLSAPLLEPTAAAITRLARAFMHAPYVWGGRSAWGLDCSGLVQTVYRAHGLFLPRDADQQQAAGAEVAPAEARAADLLFLPGHVMIALGERSFIHANAHNMRVTVDNFSTDDYGRGLWAELARVVRVRGLEGR